MDIKNVSLAGFVALVVAVLSSLFMQRYFGQSVLVNDQNRLVMLGRIEELEWLLEDEVEARLDLQELLESGSVYTAGAERARQVNDERPASQNNPTDLPNQSEVGSSNSITVADEASIPENSQPFRAQRQGQRAERRQPDFKRQQLVEYGFAEDEAAWIVQRESEIQLSNLFDSYSQRRQESQQSLSDDGATQRLSASQQLRVEIGDDYYERYLEAQGFPTSVTVGSVMRSSPGESAGLLAGDTIISYDGSRVFSLQEVNELTVKGNVGESVLIEVQRVASQVQLAIPRGPIGVTQERGRFRR